MCSIGIVVIKQASAMCVVCSVPGARVQGLESVLSVRRRRGGSARPRVWSRLQTVPRWADRRRITAVSDRSRRQHENDSAQTVRYTLFASHPATTELAVSGNLAQIIIREVDGCLNLSDFAHALLNRYEPKHIAERRGPYFRPKVMLCNMP